MKENEKHPLENFNFFEDLKKKTLDSGLVTNSKEMIIYLVKTPFIY